MVNQGKKYGDKGWRSWDFRLNDAELALFLKNGFVVSPRLGSVNAPNILGLNTGGYQIRSTFADVFYRVFNDDLPVFISADSALHAWHYSFTRLAWMAAVGRVPAVARGTLNEHVIGQS